jgi:oligopeptide/dipeptide ABC transporter ATP-binding protein
MAADAAPVAADREVLVAVDDLVKYYPIFGGLLRRKIADVKAVDGVTFDVRRGEVLGLVGESGCGKSTLGKTLIRLQPPTGGRATIAGEDIFAKRGHDLKKLRRRMQIIFQDPVGSLNPRMPISDIIGEGLLAQADAENGWGKRKVRDKRVEDFLEAVGLRRDYTRRYPHEFSGGQRQRIGIARALALDPEFVICDEPVSALDVSIQSQILNLLLDLRREFNLTYMFIAHNLSVVQYISDRVGVMYLGKLVELADVDQLYTNPRHPYTVALLSAVPDPDPRIRKKRLVLKGDVPSPAAPPSGCRFHTRCWLYERLNRPENCVTDDPAFRDIGGGHRVACHWAEEVPASVVSEVVPTLELETANGHGGEQAAAVAPDATRYARPGSGGAAGTPAASDPAGETSGAAGA